MDISPPSMIHNTPFPTFPFSVPICPSVSPSLLDVDFLVCAYAGPWIVLLDKARSRIALFLFSYDYCSFAELILNVVHAYSACFLGLDASLTGICFVLKVLFLLLGFFDRTISPCDLTYTIYCLSICVSDSNPVTQSFSIATCRRWKIRNILSVTVRFHYPH